MSKAGSVELGEYSITSPPAILGDLVIVGSAIGDNRATDLERGIVHRRTDRFVCFGSNPEIDYMTKLEPIRLVSTGDEQMLPLTASVRTHWSPSPDF